MTVTISGTDGIVTPGLTNTGTETLVNLTTTGNTTLGDASTDTLNVGNGGLIKDASGNVGVGVTPSAWSLGKAIELNSLGSGLWSSGARNIRLSNNVIYTGGAYKYATTGFASLLTMGDDSTLTFAQAASGTAGNSISFTSPLTLDASGNLLVGTTSTGYTSSGSTYYSPSVQYWINNHLTGTSSGTRYIGFGIGTGEVGSITQNGTTGVLYNLTSDYRLKNDQQPLTGAKKFVMALQPKKWQWWDGSGEGVGFVAHEFMEVAKYSGHGEKDAVDADGKPVYQSIQPSSSEVMANLVAFIQEQQALITTLTDRITALESA